MSRPARLTAVLLALAAPLLFAGPASAEEPLALTEEITDTADVLDSGEESQVQDLTSGTCPRRSAGDRLEACRRHLRTGPAGGKWSSCAMPS